MEVTATQGTPITNGTVAAEHPTLSASAATSSKEEPHRGSKEHAAEPGIAGAAGGDSSAPHCTAAAPATGTVRPSWDQLPEVLQLMPPWIKWPEYSKTENINAMITALWPYMSTAAEMLVYEQFPAWARDFVAKQGRGVLVDLSLDALSLGQHPVRLEAVKVNETEEEELMIEGPLAWASTMQVRVSAHIKLLKWTFKLPLELRDLQLKVHARIIARPIRDTPPFVSTLTVSLLERPHLQFELPVKLPSALFNPLQLGHVLSAGSSVKAWRDSHGRGKAPPAAAPQAGARPPAGGAEQGAAAAEESAGAPGEEAASARKEAAAPGEEAAAPGDATAVVDGRISAPLAEGTAAQAAAAAGRQRQRAAAGSGPTRAAAAAEPAGPGSPGTATADRQKAPAEAPAGRAALAGLDQAGRPITAAGAAEAATTTPPELEPTEIDLMALPLVNEGFRLAAAKAAQALLMYPKGYTLELVPGGSRRQWPAGMVVVKLSKITGLERLGDVLQTSAPYCILQVREGRMNCATGTYQGGDLEFEGQEFVMLVDSIKEQSLRLTVKTAEWGRKDDVLGAADLPLKQASFMYLPGTRVPFTIDLHKMRLRQPWSILTSPVNLLWSTLYGVMTAAGDVEGHAGETQTPTASPRAAASGQATTAGPTTSDLASESGQAAATEATAAAPPGIGGRDGRQGLRLQRSRSLPDLSALAAQSGDAQEKMNRAKAERDLRKQQAQQMPAAQGGQQQRAGLAGLAKGAEHAVRAGHEDEQEVEAVAKYQQQQCEHSQGGNTQQQATQAAQVQQEQQGQVGKQGQQDAPRPGQQPAQQAAGEEGKAQAQNQAPVIGTAFLEVVWTPFTQQEVQEQCQGGSGFGSALGPPLAYQCAAQGRVADSYKGILTVTVLRAINLVGWEGEPDIYVTLVLVDKVQHKHIKQTSSTVFNEPHPRFGEAFDFAMICAGSVLRVAVMDKAPSSQRLLPHSAKPQDKELGHVHIPIQRVAAAGRIKHEWALVGAEQGAVELVLEWLPEAVTAGQA